MGDKMKFRIGVVEVAFFVANTRFWSYGHTVGHKVVKAGEIWFDNTKTDVNF